MDFEFDVCVVGGAGHVGLPLSIALAEKGKKVVIQDINENALRLINNGKLPFMESNAGPILKKVINTSLFTETNPEIIGKAEFVVVIIGTPVDEHLNPKYSEIIKLFQRLLPYMRTGSIIILRSTVYPGVTKKISELTKAQKKNISVCFCPERTVEGKSMKELVSLPQIVSGFEQEAIQRTKKLFSLLTDSIVEVSPLDAELVKLFTNSFRYIQFAISNQFYMMCKEYGANFDDVYHAMTHNYPRMKLFPKPGFAAGPCLFKDTMQLSAFSNNKFFLGHSAMLINEGLPNFLVESLQKIVDLSSKTVGVLGMAFKANIDDSRESLSYKLKKILELEAKKVICSDPYVKDESLSEQKKVIQEADIIVIGAPHKQYIDLKIEAELLVDVWNINNTKDIRRL